jgi:uncharacterized damage-inducible protein DinB
MVFYGGKDLARSFRQVRANTIIIAQEIPEPQYGYQAAPEVRSIGRLLAHIALAPEFQLHVHANRLDDLKQVNFMEVVGRLLAEEEQPRTKAELLALLTAEGERFASFLDAASDTFLSEPVTMPPGAQPATKTRFEMLLSPKEHEMHHRGQLMLMQRMIGQVPHLTRQMQERMAQRQSAPARG